MLDAIAQPLNAGSRHRSIAGLTCYQLMADYRQVQIRNKYLTPYGENPLAGVAPAKRSGTVVGMQRARIAPETVLIMIWQQKIDPVYTLLVSRHRGSHLVWL